MEKWNYYPLVSIGKISFGMKRSELRNEFINKYEEFEKNKFSKNTTDDFGKFHVYYSAEDLVEAVEIFEGIEVEFEGKIIFPSSIDRLKKAFCNLEQDGDCYLQIENSFGIYAPNGKIESILMGCKGYYA